ALDVTLVDLRFGYRGHRLLDAVSLVPIGIRSQKSGVRRHTPGWLESRNLRYGFRIEAREKLHQQVDGAVEIGPFDHAVVAVQIARGHGEIDGRRSRGVTLQFRQVLSAAGSDFGLEGNVRA